MQLRKGCREGEGEGGEVIEEGWGEEGGRDREWDLERAGRAL